MTKKAQGLSMNVIAGTIIVLVVVIVLIIIFTGKLSIFSTIIGGCDSKPGGKCVEATQCPGESDGNYYSQKTGFKCPEKEKVCCYSLCVASGGKCESQCSSEAASFGASDCPGGNLCCKD